eukprot:CAMPEP_0194088608 /NCGR_PEP_ID=MMETSP0149-20130528/29919_1 /TAXON_ID=122233 /ORGANISM="Chaetoceros debilis, Strain MM31A-1" /LENGTH=414 /DNA_ID=CAMNT_0038772299 /DNA_START=208 /DNA_END=1452 /DNA_ORIENTATION=+
MIPTSYQHMLARNPTVISQSYNCPNRAANSELQVQPQIGQIRFMSANVKLEPAHTPQQTSTSSSSLSSIPPKSIRLSRLIAIHGLNMQMSRKSADMLIKAEQVTVAGKVITDPTHRMTLYEAYSGIKVAGRLVRFPNPRQSKNSGGDGDGSNESNSNTSMSTEHKKSNEQQAMRTRVWLAHKLSGELVTEHDPSGRPSLLERLSRGGVGKPKKKNKGSSTMQIHLNPVGRLDMITEGLILITNDGKLKRELELPSNRLHRTYRARVHGLITLRKLKSLRNGMEIDGTYYKGMKVNLETNKGKHVKGGHTNSWLRITCVEGKNRQIRKTLDHLGLKVTRLIRTGFGDYELNTIPPGMAIEVPVKPLKSQKRRGTLVSPTSSQGGNKNKGPNRGPRSRNNRSRAETASPVEWIRYQ